MLKPKITCIVSGSGQGANHLDRQDGRLPDLPVQGLARSRDSQLQVLGDERARASEQRGLRKCFNMYLLFLIRRWA